MKHSPAKIEHAEKTRLALELRKAGHSYQTIAEQVGYAGKSGAYRAISTAIRNIPREAVEELRAVELARLDALQTGIWQRAIKGDLKAIDAAIRLTEARARLLGLNAPIQTEDVGAGFTHTVRIIGVDASLI